MQQMTRKIPYDCNLGIDIVRDKNKENIFPFLRYAVMILDNSIYIHDMELKLQKKKNTQVPVSTTLFLI